MKPVQASLLGLSLLMSIPEESRPMALSPGSFCILSDVSPLAGRAVSNTFVDTSLDYLEPDAELLEDDLLLPETEEDGIFLTLVDDRGDLLDGDYKYVFRLPEKLVKQTHGLRVWAVLQEPLLLRPPNPMSRAQIGLFDGPRSAKDGSVTIYIQRDNPGAARQRNWLPVQGGTFTLILLLNHPCPCTRDWDTQLPAVERTDDRRRPLARPK